MSKLFNLKLDKDIADVLEKLSKKHNLSKSETIRKAINFLNERDNEKPDNNELESENKKLIVTVKTMEVLRHETAELYEQTKKAKEKEAELYEQLLSQQRAELSSKEKEFSVYEQLLQKQKVELMTKEECINQLKTDFQKKDSEVNLLQGKVEEIKKAGIIKRIFLNFA